jgi:diaminopimelate epimerase
LFARVDVHRVDVGNPHAVSFGIPTDWEARGAAVERSVPGRTNVQFVELVDAHTLRARVWERGAGRTRSSGSSACAVATVGVALGWVASPVRVEMEGGVLRVDVSASGAVDLRGPVEAIGRMTLDGAWVERRVSRRIE